MLAHHVISDEKSIQQLIYLNHTGQFEQCLQQGMFTLPHLHAEKKQAAVLCELIEAAFQLSKFQEAAYYLPLLERAAASLKNSAFLLHLLLYKGHFHIQIHGDATTALAYYKEGLSLAFEIKAYDRLAEFIKYILRYVGTEETAEKLLPLAELAYIFSQQAGTKQETARLSAAMALLECYSLAGKVEPFEQLEKQLAILPSLPNFPGELTRLQLLRAKILAKQGYYAQAFCFMKRTTLYYEKQQEYYLLLQQLAIQKQLTSAFIPEKADATCRKIEKIRKLAEQASLHFEYSMKKEKIYSEEKAICRFHESVEEQLADKEPFLYLLAFTEDAACYEALLHYSSPKLPLSGNRILYVFKDSSIPADFPALGHPSICLAAVFPHEGSSAMQLFHKAHARMYYMMPHKK